VFGVTGVGFHYDQNKVYISVSSGWVYSLYLGVTSPIQESTEYSGDDLEAESTVGLLTVVYRSTNNPQAISVDWLNDMLYVAELNQVHQYLFRQ
jgi:hypothetical protein